MAVSLAAGVWLGVASLATAQQVETTVPCIAGAPTILPYGAVTSGCSFSSGLDDDELLVNGELGSVVRVVIAGTSGGVAPVLRVFDGNGAVVALFDPSSGAALASPVSFATPGGVQFSPAVVGDTVLVISESGGDDAGGYELSVSCAAGPCDSDGALPIDPAPPVLAFDAPALDALSPATDGDVFGFQGTAGSLVRLVVSATSGAIAPLVEIRDPNGASVPLLQASFPTPGAVEFAMTTTGPHTLLVFENGHDQTGGYALSLNCIVGACDSDLDGFLDPDASPVAYGVAQPPEPERTAGLTTALDVDAFSFEGAAGTTVRVALAGLSGGVAPTFEIRDPSGAVVQAPTSCPAPCAIDVALGADGTHRLIVSDTDYDNAGRYQFTLTCQAGACPTALPTLAPVCTGGSTSACRDNCRLVADMSQADIGGIGAGAAPDGIGDRCQCGDVSGNGRVTTADATLITRSLLAPPTATLAQPQLCNVGGSSACTTADAVIVTRALLVPPTVAVQQACAPAFR